jgi:aquaporin Z
VSASLPALSGAVQEFLFTFFLAYVVLNVASSQDHDDNSFYVLLHASRLASSCSLAPRPSEGFSGAAFNPAVAIAASAIGLFSWSAIWTFLIANFAGGAVAAPCVRLLNPDDLKPLHSHRDEEHAPAVPTA